jgi:hypothetical protein
LKETFEDYDTQIAVMNRTTTMNDEDITRYIADLQMQISKDCFPIYDKSATLYFHPDKTDPPPTHWKLVVMHTNGEPRRPFGVHKYNEVTNIANGYIFIDHILDFGYEISKVMSHELLEMITNPKRELVSVGGIKYINEICDPIGSSSYAIGGTYVSNFVFPTFYGVDTKSPYDFCGLVSSPMTVLEDGIVTSVP